MKTKKKNRNQNLQRESSEKMAGPIIVGRNPIREILRQSPERIKRVFVAAGLDSPEVSRLLAEIGRHRIMIDEASEMELSQLAAGANHQGFAAELTPLATQSLRSLLENLSQESRAVLILADSIQDPHNLGAIARAAECFGAAAVLYSSNRGCSITPVVTKASAGAAHLMPLIDVGNLSQALQRCSEAGFWSVASAIDPTAIPLPQLKMPDRAIILIGSEGDGLHDLLLRQADHKVYIPMSGKIDSLNVSQATAVLLYEWSKGQST